ncbi:MAG: hypothetical protein ACHQ4G_02965 [Opitutales bacterium]
MKTKLLLACLLAAGLLPAARADVDVHIGAQIRLGQALPPPPPEIVVQVPMGPPGSPPWAQGHWFRRHQAYYYYPESSVYFRPGDRMWFYLAGGRWQASVQLPESIQVDFDRCVPLTMQTDRPYEYQSQVIAYYPSRYFSQVKIKERRPSDEKGRRGDHDEDRAKDRRHDQN